MKCHVAGNVGDAEQFCGYLCPLHPPGGEGDVRTVLTFHAGHQVTGALFNLMKSKPGDAPSEVTILMKGKLDMLQE